MFVFFLDFYAILMYFLVHFLYVQIVRLYFNGVHTEILSINTVLFIFEAEVVELIYNT